MRRLTTHLLGADSEVCLLKMEDRDFYVLEMGHGLIGITSDLAKGIHTLSLVSRRISQEKRLLLTALYR